ncbi:MAG: hypothetical protein P8Y04_03030 [Desulfobulbaceae bacterium]
MTASLKPSNANSLIDPGYNHGEWRSRADEVKGAIEKFFPGKNMV